MDFDKVLEHCGNFGRYQVIMLLLFGYINILSSLHYFSQTIISFTPEHWCYHDKLSNLSFDEISKIYEGTKYPSCTLLDDVINGTAVIAEVGECKQWIYKYESGYKSVTTELNWVCDTALQSAIGQSCYFIGSVIGTIGFGIFADRCGRLPALIATTLAGAFGDLITSFTYNLPTYCIARFCSGLSTDSLFCIMYIMVFEYLNPKKRTFGMNINTTVFYSLGLCISPWAAIWVKTWRNYLLVASLPALAVILYPFLICESAHWLITKQKYDKAIICLKRVAKINGRKVDESIFIEFVEYYQNKNAAAIKLNERKDTFSGMLRTPRLRKFTIILMLKAMIVTLSYDVLSRNVEGFGSSPFLLFSISSLGYIPGGLAIMCLQNIIGRKGMASGALFATAIITAVTGYMTAFFDLKENAVLLAIMIFLGRFGACIVYDAEAQYASELIPTSVRGRGVANIHVIGYVVAFFSSYVIYMGTIYKPLPSIFLTFIMLIGSALCLYLPETLNKKLPETLADGEQFGLNEHWWYFSCFSNASTKSKPKQENDSVS